MKKNLDILILCAVLQLAAGLLLSRLYLLYHNTLSRNGDWISSKPGLAVEVMGAFSFIEGRQALARGHLNLGTWHGFQEVLYRERLHLDELEFDFLLGPHAYLNIIFNRAEGGFSGIRLSATKKFESIYFRATGEGEFTRKSRIEVRGLRPAAWHHLRLSGDDEGFTVYLDDRAVGRFEEPFLAKTRVGFRGGLGGSYIDNVVIGRRGADTVRESFSGLKGFGGVTALALLAVLAANGAFYAVLRLMSRLKGRRLGFSVASANILLIIAGLLLYACGYFRAHRYPVVDERAREREAAWMEMRGRESLESIEKGYGLEPDPRVNRILFLGTSQTWGAGAAESGKTITGYFERMLNRTGGAGIRSECINGSIPAADSSDLLKFYEEELRGLEPDIVVINISNNDAVPDEFEANLRGILESVLEGGARPVLVMEPKSVECNTSFLRSKHEVMRKLGEESGVPVIDMHGYLSDRRDDGFLWWDKVHLTSFGQRLFAEKLYDEMAELLRSRAHAGREGG